MYIFCIITFYLGIYQTEALGSTSYLNHDLAAHYNYQLLKISFVMERFTLHKNRKVIQFHKQFTKIGQGEKKGYKKEKRGNK